MLLHEFKSPDANPTSIIDTVFLHNGHSYKIEDITKSWGKSPVLLGYAEAKDEKGKIHTFFIKCTASFRQNQQWTIRIETVPDSLKSSL